MVRRLLVVVCLAGLAFAQDPVPSEESLKKAYPDLCVHLYLATQSQKQLVQE